MTAENGDEQECNLTTMPCVQRSLWVNEVTDDFGNVNVEVPLRVDGRTRDVFKRCIHDQRNTQFNVPRGVNSQTRDMLERCMATSGRTAGARAKIRSRAPKEASAQERRGYNK